MKSSIFRRIESQKSKKRKRSCSAGCPSSDASKEPLVKKEIFHVNYDDYNLEKNPSSNRISSLSGQCVRRMVHEKENKHSSKKFSRKIETKDIMNYAMHKYEHILDFDKILELVLQDGKPEVNRKKRARLVSVVKKSAKNPRNSAGDEVHAKVMHKSKKSRHVLYQEKGKKPRTKANKSIADLYNIDNFVVQSNSLKIVEKTTPGLNIPVPRYQEFDENEDDCSVKDSSNSDSEDISDELYLKYHNQYENREREYREKYYMENKKKNGKKAALANNRNNEAAPLSHTGSCGINNLKFKIELDRNLPIHNEEDGNNDNDSYLA